MMQARCVPRFAKKSLPFLFRPAPAMSRDLHGTQSLELRVVCLEYGPVATAPQLAFNLEAANLLALQKQRNAFRRRDRVLHSCVPRIIGAEDGAASGARASDRGWIGDPLDAAATFGADEKHAMNPIGRANLAVVTAVAIILSLALREIQWFDVGRFSPVELRSRRRLSFVRRSGVSAARANRWSHQTFDLRGTPKRLFSSIVAPGATPR